jgi:hypothetical protein
VGPPSGRHGSRPHCQFAPSPFRSARRCQGLRRRRLTIVQTDRACRSLKSLAPILREQKRQTPQTRRGRGREHRILAEYGGGIQPLNYIPLLRCSTVTNWSSFRLVDVPCMADAAKKDGEITSHRQFMSPDCNGSAVSRAQPTWKSARTSGFVPLLVLHVEACLQLAPSAENPRA